ncbi:CoA transferase [Paraburkholderia sediminicola]|uniref:CoA transferase n=1 Tax=Paraburkholderia rhynchosiae TaxID=487049 RepID=A0ACC7NMW4_9BURK
MEQKLPLDGVTVVEICHSFAGPYAGSILAQLGANVIKVENPGRGDDARAWGPPNWGNTSTSYHAMNRDKSGIALDMKDETEAAALRRFIVEEADVVIQSLRAGAIDPLGFGAAELRALKPSLIYCNLSAFGNVGPLKGKPGYDPLVQARSGLMSVTGNGGDPVRIGTSIVDMGSGMWCAIGILAALNKRNQTGEGTTVDASLFETGLSWMTVHMAGYSASGIVRKPMGSGLVEIVPHQAFTTCDGHVMIAAANDSLFSKLATAIGRADLTTDPLYSTNNARVINRETLIPLLNSILATNTASHWVDVLDAAGVPIAPLQTIDQVAKDPQAEALGIFQKPEGVSDLALTGIPLNFDGQRPALRRLAPDLGQHNELVLGKEESK